MSGDTTTPIPVEGIQLTIQPPVNSVTIMVGNEPFMIRAEITDTTTMTANRVQREIAIGLLRAAIEVMGREPDPLAHLMSEAVQR